MNKIYLKPETIIIEVESQKMMAGSIGQITNTDPVVPGTEDAKPFDFTPLEEQEESTRVSTTNEEDWDEFEEEE